MSARLQLRRAGTVFSYWKDGELVFENYLTRKLIAAAPLATALLHVFSDWSSPDELTFGLPAQKRRQLERSIRQLREHSFLLVRGSAAERADAEFARQWKSWLPHAGIFHFGTRDVIYKSEPKDVWPMLRGYLRERRQPSFFKYDRYAERTALPKPRSRDESNPKLEEFFAILLARRTQREFSSARVELTDLSKLLFYVWGVQKFLRVPVVGDVPLKTSPSGGARHPEEVYLMALRVSGLRSGIYHYLPRRHALELVARPHDLPRRAVNYCGGQKWVGKAAALFLMTAVFDRTRWKYRMARAYRVLLAEAGHLSQTFCLAATALGLAPFSTMALADTEIESDLGLDSHKETVLYVSGVGLAA